jgi:acetyl-CoA C-acetyltransferase
MADGSEVYVLGGYQTDFARNWTKERKHFVRHDARVGAGALRDRQVAPEEIESGHVGNFAAELYAMQGHLGAFFVEVDPAFSGLPTGRHEAACASGSIAMLAASPRSRPVATTCSAVVGVEQMKTVSADVGGDYLGTAAWYELEAKGVEFPFPKLFGKLGDEYDKRYGLKDEHLAEISAINYANAQAEPERADPHLVHEQGARPGRTDDNGGRRRPHPDQRLLAGDRRRGHGDPRVAPRSPSAGPRATA